MLTWSFYSLATGLFTGKDFSATDEAYLEANTPTGCGVMEGKYDHLSYRVDLESHKVVDWQPPKPEDDEDKVWKWNATSRRWEEDWTDKTIARMASEQRGRMLSACDWVVARAMETGEPIPPEWSAYRQALRDITKQPGFPSAIDWPTPPTK